MAKAIKPTSGGKSTTKASDANASKPDVTAAADPKAVDTPSKASQAAAGKPDNKVSGAKSDQPPEAKPAAVAKTEPAKPSAPAKPHESIVKAAEAKPDPKATSPKPEPAKGAEPAMPDPVKKPEPAKVEVKSEDKPVAKAATPAPVKQPEPAQRRSTFVPLVFGGLIAGGVGFAAAEYSWLNTRPDMDGINQMLADQQKTIAAQQEQLDAFVPADLSSVEGGIAAVSESVAGVTENVSVIETRLVELEERPVVVTADGTGPTPEYFEQLAEGFAAEYAEKFADAYTQELAGLKGTVEQQKDEIARLLDNALSVEEATAEAARAASIQAAAAKLTAALSSGAAYDTVIDDLSAAGIAELPQELAAPASDGVATLSSLQADFPAAARAALASARAAGVDAGTGGVGGFLKRQLGARSVAPRDGSDPDAVLSRAEAAVRDGRVGAALTELETLPPEVQSAMEDWLAQARTRADAEQAVQDLSERLTAN